MTDHHKQITLISFGFKYGQPNSNYYFDVSFLKNPAREKQWSLFSEPDAEMGTFVTDQPAFKDFVEKVVPLIELLTELDDDMRVSFGCNAGRHRSFFVTEEVAKILKENGHNVRVIHRERE